MLLPGRSGTCWQNKDENLERSAALGLLAEQVCVNGLRRRAARAGAGQNPSAAPAQWMPGSAQPRSRPPRSRAQCAKWVVALRFWGILGCWVVPPACWEAAVFPSRPTHTLDVCAYSGSPCLSVRIQMGVWCSALQSWHDLYPSDVLDQGAGACEEGNANFRLRRVSLP